MKNAEIRKRGEGKAGKGGREGRERGERERQIMAKKYLLSWQNIN